MKITISSALKNVNLPGKAKPKECWMYAIFYKEDGKLGATWLPDGYEAEDPGDEMATANIPGQRNPLQVILPGGESITHPDQYGECFKLRNGSIAQVFNRDRRA
jgi:hypothetical protein